jgi:tetratricopeptide (TPR) repeat protein
MADSNQHQDDEFAALTMAGLIAAAGIWSVGQSLFGNKSEKKLAEARSLINNEAYDQAMGLLLQLVEDDWECGAAHFEIARLNLYVYQDFQNAYSATQEAIKFAQDASERAAGMTLLADGYLMHNKYQMAIDSFNQALSLLVNSESTGLIAYIYLRLGYCYRLLQNFDLAQQVINNALEIEPQNEYALQQQVELNYEITRRNLYQVLVNHFNLEELKVLCFELSVDYESLSSGTGKESKVIDLITLFERRQGSLQPLIDAVLRKRPFLNA